MGVAEVDELQQILVEGAQKNVWSAGASQFSSTIGVGKLSRYGASTRDIETWIAMREADRDRLKQLHPGNWPDDRQYRSDSLPERISQAFSDMLFGEDPRFIAATPEPADGGGSGDSGDEESPDQQNLDKLVEENAIPSALRGMAMDCSAEGEQWWRVYTDPAESEYPILTFESRLDVIPLFRGRRVVAAAFVNIIFSQTIELQGEVETTTWRKVEIHSDRLARNLLFRGSQTALGTKAELTERTETANILQQWDHGLDIMLCGRIPNKLGRDKRLGISDYQGIKDQLFDLNEARTIMAENARLAAKKRAVADRKFLRSDGTVDLSKDLFITDDESGVDKELGASDKAQFAILEYTFDADALIAHVRELTGTAVTRVGLVEQFVNAGVGATDGGDASGTALKTRLIPTTLAAAGKARFIDDELPRLMVALQRVDELDTSSGGCGHPWRNSAEPPVIERTSILPEDETEEVVRHSTAVTGEIESRYTAIKAMHRDWSEKEVQDEIDRIDKDRQAGFGAPPSFTPMPNSNGGGDPALIGVQG